MNQRDIDYVPHSRPKQFYIVLPQLRSAVKGNEPPIETNDRKWGFLFAGLFCLAAVMFVLLNEGYLNFLKDVF